MSAYYLFSFIIPFILTLLIVPVVRRVALALGFIDTPSARKIHSRPIPLGGGIPLFLGFTVIMILLSTLLDFTGVKAAVGIMAGAVLIFLIGIYDDAFEMGALPKMIGQVIASLIFLSFTEDAPPIISYPVYLILGVVWIVGIQNALNFLDNMDGLCAGVAMSIALGLGVLFVLKDMPIYAFMCFALAGGALGFLRYNLPPASIFLGDTGSLLFGFALSCLAIVHVNSSRDMALALSPFIIMAYPIFDMTFVTISRLNEGRKVYIGGKDHSSHKINFMGLTRRATVFTILAINLLLVVFGITLYFISESPYQVLLVAVLAFMLALIGTHLYKNILFMRERVILLIVDFFAVNLAVLSYVILKYVLGATGALIPVMLSDLAWINIFWVMLYSAGGLYEIQPESALRDHLRPLAQLIIPAVGVFALVNYKPGQGFQVSLESLFLFSLILFCLNSVMRAWLYALTGRYLLAGKAKIDAVAVRLSSAGGNADLEALRRQYNIVGYVGYPGSCDLAYLGDVESLRQILRDRKIGRIILDLPEDHFGNLVSVFQSAFYLDSRFLISRPSAENYKGMHKSPSRFKNMYMISPGHRRLFSRIIKRMVDFAIAAIILVASLPWIIFKVLYARVKNVNFAEKITFIGLGEKQKSIRGIVSGDKFSLRNPWGLLSVLRGDLSLVGVTLATPAEAVQIKGSWRKFCVKPGLFGPGYDGRDLKERFELDLEYLERPSLIRELIVALRQIAKFPRIKGIGPKDA